MRSLLGAQSIPASEMWWASALPGQQQQTGHWPVGRAGGGPGTFLPSPSFPANGPDHQGEGAPMQSPEAQDPPEARQNRALSSHLLLI